MDPHNIMQRMMESDNLYPDPGSSGTIHHDRFFQDVHLVSTAAQARTLARPKKLGAYMTVLFKTDGGDVTLTVTGGYNEQGDTTIIFSDAGQFATFKSMYDGTNYYWRLINELSFLTLATEAGAGFTGGTGTVYKTSVESVGNIITTRILVDLTGLASSTTDLDIIGVGASVAHIGQITAARNGTILAIRMTCLELPAGGADDIDLYAATEGTGVFDGGIAALTETALITSGAAWANGTVKGSIDVPAADQYLYLTGGEAGTAATYTAGKFLIELFGYR